MVSTHDLLWLSGWIEGEGSFGFWGRLNHETPRIAANTTDRDVAERVARLLSVPVKGPWPPRGKNAIQFPHAKPHFAITLYGPRAVGWMMTLYSLMGQRRKSKILEVLNQWKSLVPRKSSITNNRKLFQAERANRN